MTALSPGEQTAKVAALIGAERALVRLADGSAVTLRDVPVDIAARLRVGSVVAVRVEGRRVASWRIL